jgi:flagellar basal body-associated protein FliL
MKNFIRHFFIQFVSILACLAIIAAVLLVVKPRLGKKGGQPAEAAAAKEPLVTLPLEEFTVNLADTDRGHYLKITVVLELPGKDAAKKIQEFKPQVQDAVVATLTRQYYRALQSPGGKDQLKKQLKERINVALRDAGVEVRNVLFIEFVMQ